MYLFSILFSLHSTSQIKFMLTPQLSFMSAAFDFDREIATHVFVVSFAVVALHFVSLKSWPTAHQLCFPAHSASLPDVQYVVDWMFEFSVGKCKKIKAQSVQCALIIIFITFQCFHQCVIFKNLFSA